MSTFSTEMANLALELIQEFGAAISFTRTSGGTYSTSSLGLTGTTTTTFSAYGVAVNYEKRDIDGTTIQLGDNRLFVNATGTAPLRGDIVTYSNIQYHVMNVLQYDINAVAVLYELQVRA